MAHFAGQTFSGFSIPLIFEDRVFILESADSSLITVVRDLNGEPFFEILKNEPCATKWSVASIDSARVVTVCEKASGRFLYRVGLGTETIVSFRKPDDKEFSVAITDEEIRAGGMIFNNHPFRDAMAGVLIDPEIEVGMMDPPVPAQVARWLS
jgi:hypothetical protein